MNPESIKLTAFTTPFGRYEFLRMPFGLQNGTFEFSRLMERLFGHLNFMAHFVDDIAFFSKDFKTHITEESIKIPIRFLNKISNTISDETN